MQTAFLQFITYVKENTSIAFQFCWKQKKYGQIQQKTNT
jgi:hypothetical protein